MALTGEGAVKPNFYLGNYPPGVTGFDYALGVADLAIGIIKHLAKPEPNRMLPKAQNGRAYASPHQAQVQRISGADKMPIRSGIAREIGDGLAMVFHNPQTNTPARKLHITREQQELRASSLRGGRHRQEVFTNVDFYGEIVDEETLFEIAIDHMASKAVLIATNYAGEREGVELEANGDEAVTIGDIEGYFPGVIAGMGRALVVAETFANHPLTRDFESSYKLTDQKEFSPRKDPHTSTPNLLNAAVDVLTGTVFARQSS